MKKYTKTVSVHPAHFACGAAQTNGPAATLLTLIVKPCAAAISCTANAHRETFAVNQVPVYINLYISFHQDLSDVKLTRPRRKRMFDICHYYHKKS
jgi:hypothetical protein